MGILCREFYAESHRPVKLLIFRWLEDDHHPGLFRPAVHRSLRVRHLRLALRLSRVLAKVGGTANAPSSAPSHQSNHLLPLEQLQVHAVRALEKGETETVDSGIERLLEDFDFLLIELLDGAVDVINPE